MNNILQSSRIMTILATILPFLVAMGFICYEATAVYTGTPVSLTVTGYDPADILRGQYIRYELLLEDVKPMEPFSESRDYYGTEGYLSIIDSNGDGIYDSFGGFYWTEVPEVYLKAKCNWLTEDGGRFSLIGNQGRYYLDEKISLSVEKAINEAGSFEINGTVLGGFFRATDIVVNGIKY